MRDLGRRIDLHVHTLLGDGEVLPSEILRRAEALNYEAIAITEHVDASNIKSVIMMLASAARQLNSYLKTKLYFGVELTHIPPSAISSLASEARSLGAQIIIVHGETLAEPVAPGTNHAALLCKETDVLAHPGLITPEDCELAARNGVYLELSARKGHCITNGHVARLASYKGAKLLVNTDLHSPDDFITQQQAFHVALGAGLTEDEAKKAIKDNPLTLLDRIERATQ
jgi:putative hydrolase